MKKLFTLLIVMLLWQSAAVAQSFLQIITPEGTTEIPMAELDSVTIRLPKYCPLSSPQRSGISSFIFLYLLKIRNLS